MNVDVEGLLAARPVERPSHGRLALGSRVGGWRVEAFLGSGRSAEVYRVVSTGFGGEGALKLLVDESHGLADRFRREMEVLRSVSVSSLPRFFASGELAGRPWYVMEYLQPLFLPLNRGEVAQFMRSLAGAVGELHAAGLVHCDLKPGNVLLRRNGEPVLIDLGLVRRIGERTREGVGTMDFAAPEQLLKGEATERSDVFALGKILRAAGGRHLSRRLKAVALKATHEDPAERYASASEFASALAPSRHLRYLMGGIAVFLAFLATYLLLSWGQSPKVGGGVSPIMPGGQAPGVGGLSPLKMSFEEAKKAAEAGDMDAGAVVAECYFHGRGVATNLEEAVVWYSKAAESGHLGAQDSLGCCLLYGWGCEADPEEAVRWFTRAAEQEHLSAMNNLAYCYLTGKGVVRDEHRAFVWAKAAADQGHAPSQTMVAECYLDGRGVEKDLDSALIWLRRAARKGNKRARRLLDAMSGEVPSAAPLNL